MKIAHHSKRTTAAATFVRRKKLLATAISLALALATPAACVASGKEWGVNSEIFGRFSNNRVIGGVEVLAPLWQNSNNLTFGELKAYYSDRSSKEFNIGLGHRWLNADDSWILGGFAHYDRRSTRYGNNFSQLTVGAEALGTLFDARLNYYHPYTDEKLVQGWVGGLIFSGHSAFTNETYEEALRGWDGEVGVLLPVSDSVETRIYAGAYTLDGDLNSSTTGWRARLEARPLKSLSLELGHRDDDIFGAETFFTVRYSFGKPNKSGRRTLRERMNQPTMRDLDILVSPPVLQPVPLTAGGVVPGTPGTPIPPGTPGTPIPPGTPVSIIHIDSKRGTPEGDGTYERPYQSVDACLVGKCSRSIGGVGGEDAYVRFWKGYSTETSPYSAQGSWGLLNGQTIWGEGWVVPDPDPNPVYNLDTLLAQGSFDAGMVPWFTPGGAGNPGFVLANDNEVMGVGVDVKGDGAYGFYGENVTGFDIHHNVIRSESAGIVIATTEGSSRGVIEGNIIEVTPVFEPLPEPSVLEIAPLESDGGPGLYSGIALINLSEQGMRVTQEVDLTGNQVTMNAPMADSVYSSYRGDLYDGIFLANSAFYGEASQTANLSGNQVAVLQDTPTDGTTYSGDLGAVLRAFNVATTAEIGQPPATATQTINLDGDSFTGNVTYGGHVTNSAQGMGTTATQTLGGEMVSFQGLPERMTRSYVGVDVTQYAESEGTANQTVDLTDLKSTGYDDGVAIYNEAYDEGQATQTTTITDLAIDSERDGLFVENAIWGDGQATQTTTITGLAIDAGLEGLVVENDADGDGQVTQTLTVSDATIDSVRDAVHIENLGEYGGIANQTVNLTKVTAISEEEEGGDLYNYAYNYGQATQTVTIGGSTIRGFDEAIDVENEAYSDATAIQFFTIADSTVTNTVPGGGADEDDSIDINGYASSENSRSEQTAIITNTSIEGLIGVTVDGYTYSGQILQDVTISGGQITATDIGVDVVARPVSDEVSQPDITQLVDLTNANITAPNLFIVDPDTQNPGGINQVISPPIP